MTLIDNWREIAAKSWSSRLAWLAALLSAVEVALPFLQTIIPAALVPPGTFAWFALLVSAGAGVARLVAQPKMQESIEAKNAQ